jgi:hypothetical protein
MSLPEATPNDLRRMGITPEAIREQIERRGQRVNGRTVSVSVLTTDVALLNFDLSRLAISSPVITLMDTEPAVPGST